MVRQQAAHDVDPPLSETAAYIKNEMTTEGYRHLLAVGALFLSPWACHASPSIVLVIIILLLAESGQPLLVAPFNLGHKQALHCLAYLIMSLLLAGLYQAAVNLLTLGQPARSLSLYTSPAEPTLRNLCG